MDYYKQMFPKNKALDVIKFTIFCMSAIFLAILYSCIFSLQAQVESLQDKTSELEFRMASIENSSVVCLDDNNKTD